MANKQQRSIRLSLFLWAQIDDLIEFYGDSDSEVLTHIVTDWLSENRADVTAQKRIIDELQPKIQALQAKEDAKARRKKADT